MSHDTLYRGTIHNDQFRLFAVDCTDTVQQARDLHDLSPLPSILLGRLICAAALSGEPKAPRAELSLRCRGWLLQGAIALADKEGISKRMPMNPNSGWNPQVRTCKWVKSSARGS